MDRQQGQVDDRDRTIRLQKNLIEQLEAEKHKTAPTSVEAPKECVTTATQTERVCDLCVCVCLNGIILYILRKLNPIFSLQTRPLSIGMEGLSR